MTQQEIVFIFEFFLVWMQSFLFFWFMFFMLFEKLKIYAITSICWSTAFAMLVLLFVFKPFYYSMLNEFLLAEDEKGKVVLTKDLPNCPKGTVFNYLDGSFKNNDNQHNKMYHFTPKEVENNPEWFELKE